MTRPPLNGFQLLAAFPSLRDGVHIGPRWIVVVDRGEGTPDRYVSAWVTSLDSPTWDLGSYHRKLGDAIREALERVGYDVAPITIH
jgi:hypothetical protein